MNPFKLYMRSYRAQMRWIRRHPVQYVLLNVGLIAAQLGYYAWVERRETRAIRPLHRGQPARHVYSRDCPDCNIETARHIHSEDCEFCNPDLDAQVEAAFGPDPTAGHVGDDDWEEMSTWAKSFDD